LCNRHNEEQMRSPTVLPRSCWRWHCTQRAAGGRPRARGALRSTVPRSTVPRQRHDSPLPGSTSTSTTAAVNDSTRSSRATGRSRRAGIRAPWPDTSRSVAVGCIRPMCAGLVNSRGNGHRAVSGVRSLSDHARPVRGRPEAPPARAPPERAGAGGLGPAARGPRRASTLPGRASRRSRRRRLGRGSAGRG
jgi:hypothetical protein